MLAFASIFRVQGMHFKTPQNSDFLRFYSNIFQQF